MVKTWCSPEFCVVFKIDANRKHSCEAEKLVDNLIRTVTDVYSNTTIPKTWKKIIDKN